MLFFASLLVTCFALLFRRDGREMTVDLNPFNLFVEDATPLRQEAQQLVALLSGAQLAPEDAVLSEALPWELWQFFRLLKSHDSTIVRFHARWSPPLLPHPRTMVDGGKSCNNRIKSQVHS